MILQAEELGMNPLYLMFPVTIAVQFAFMLPVATPPNAVAFTTGRITVLDMVYTFIQPSTIHFCSYIERVK